MNTRSTHSNLEAVAWPAICGARDPQEFEQAYRLRYEVFTGEKGDHRYAIEPKKIYVDAIDGRSGHLLIAKNTRHEVVATLRVSLRKEAPFWEDHLYPYDLIADRVGIDRNEIKNKVSLIERGVVKKGYRGAGVFEAMVNAAETLSLMNESPILLVVVAGHNQAAQQFFARREWSPYLVVEDPRAWTGAHLYKDLRNQESRVQGG